MILVRVLLVDATSTAGESCCTQALAEAGSSVVCGQLLLLHNEDDKESDIKKISTR